MSAAAGTQPAAGQQLPANGKTLRKVRAKTAAKRQARIPRKLAASAADVSTIQPTPARAAAMTARATAHHDADPVIAGLLVDFPEACKTLDMATAWLQVAASTFTLRGLKGSIAITAKAA